MLKLIKSFQKFKIGEKALLKVKRALVKVFTIIIDFNNAHLGILTNTLIKNFSKIFSSKFIFIDIY